MSVPSAATRLFQAVNMTFRISGATHVAVSDIRVAWGYALNEEHVTGTPIPYLGTGGFHGTVDANALGASDNRFEQLVSATSGILTTFGMTWIEGDTQSTASTRTWTISGKFTEYEKIGEKDGFIKYRVKGLLVTEPTVA